jgi:hypothetical protein
MPSLDPDSVSAYLTSFLDIIMKLERLGTASIRGGMPSPGIPGYEGVMGGGQVGSMGSGELTEGDIEERELVEWASLKECQMKFMRENGVGRWGLDVG